MSREDERLTVTVVEAARLLGISRNLAYQAIRLGQLPAISVGRRLLVPRAALLQMLEARRSGCGWSGEATENTASDARSGPQ